MQFDPIETFLDLCETRSFNRTAERLGVTQSTVSGRVAALEKTVGRRLFIRSRGGTELTVEGMRFEPHARNIRHAWETALHATRDVGIGGVKMRVGIQHDLIGINLDRLITSFRDSLQDMDFYVEADYSTQICADLVSGSQDVAVLYSPKAHPDIHFQFLGEVTYIMVSSVTDKLRDVASGQYILANYSAAFCHSHAALLPELMQASLSVGQNAVMIDCLKSLPASAYVLRHSAQELLAAGHCHAVLDAPEIAQPIFAGVNLRNRHRASYRRMLTVLQRHFVVSGDKP